jgi:hypothetical protein
MVWATKVLTARCVRRKVEKDVVAAMVVERDTMAEVVDLRAKVTGAKGAVAVEEEGIKREVKEIIFLLTFPHVFVIFVRMQDILHIAVRMHRSLQAFWRLASGCKIMVEIQRRVQNQEEDNGYGEYSMMMRVLPDRRKKILRVLRLLMFYLHSLLCSTLALVLTV